MSNDSSKAPVKPEVSGTPAVAIDTKPAKWGPVSAIIISVLAYLAGSILAGLIVYAVATLLHKNLQQSNDWLASIPGQFVFVLTLEGIVFGTIFLFLKYRKATLRDIGFRRPPILTDAAKAVIGFALYFVALIAASAIAKALLNVNIDQKQELGFDHVIGNSDLTITFLSLVVLPPIGEEILFRGFLYTGMRGRLKFIPATFFVSLVFASLHLFESSQGLLWIAGIDTFILSLVLCYLREKTGNLWAPIMVHAIKNGIAFIFLYVVTSG